MARRTAKREPTRGVIYGRQSRTKTGSESLDTQVVTCRDTAEHHGITVVDVILEPPSTSAYKSRGRARPRFPEVLDLIRSGAADCVVAYKTDRLSRGGGIGWAPLVEAAEDAGLNVDKFVLIAGNGFMSEFELGIRATMDREESKKTSERLQDMKDAHAMAGKPWGGGARPFGYRHNPATKTLDVVEGEAAMIREAVARLLAGEGQSAICREWNEGGKRTAAGHLWRVSTLRNTLLRASIAGLREHHGEIVGPGTWEPIIPRTTWERVVAVLRDPARARVPSYRTSLLTGLARCGRCGAKLVVSPAEGRNRYRCQKAPGKPGCGGLTIVAEDLEELVVAATLLRLDTPALAGAQAEVAAGAAMTVDVEDDETMLAQLASMWAGRQIGQGEYLVARQEIQDRIDQRLEAARIAAHASRPSTVARLREDTEPFTVTWKRLEAEGRTADQRAVLAEVIEKVVIGPARIGLNRFDPARVDVIWRA